jgi:hypothetical protein
MPLLLASPTILAGGEITVKYTCDGADIWPPRIWSGRAADGGILRYPAR